MELPSSGSSTDLRIISVGEITIDRYEGQKDSSVAGSSLDCAVHAQRSGAELVSLVGRAGSGPMSSVN